MSAPLAGSDFDKNNQVEFQIDNLGLASNWPIFNKSIQLADSVIR